MLCIISPYAAVYAHGAHRVGRHGACGKHLRHSCDLWAWWCCLRCYCWLGCQWRDGRRPLAPLQQRLLGRGKIRNSCPEPADTWPHICIYTTSVWAAQANPRSSQLATVWLLAVVSHSWCTSSQQGRLITIVTRREKSSIYEIAKSQSRLRMSGPPHQPRARASGPRCRRCLPRPPAPAATAGRPVGSARRLHPRDVAVAERFLDRYVFQCTHPPRPSNLRCAAQLLPSETPPPAQGRHHQTLPHGRAASSVCRSARPGPLAAASIGRKPRI